MSKMNAQIEAVEETVDHVERRMVEYSSTINELVDGHREHIEGIQ